MITDLDAAIEKISQLCIEEGFFFHQDTLSDENIPEGKKSKSCRLEVGAISLVTGKQNQTIISVPVSVIVFGGPHRKSFDSLKESLSNAQKIAKRVLDPKNRTDFLFIQFSSIDPEELSVDNDNIIRSKVAFNVQIPFVI